MPTFKQAIDGGTYVLLCDRGLPPQQQVTFHYRDPLPLEVAQYEEQTGYIGLPGALAGGGGSAPEPRWISSGPSNRVRALLQFLTNVKGPGPDGLPLQYPAPGSQVPALDGKSLRPANDADRQRFLALFIQEDLYEVADHILQRRDLTEEESKN